MQSPQNCAIVPNQRNSNERLAADWAKKQKNDGAERRHSVIIGTLLATIVFCSLLASTQVAAEEDWQVAECPPEYVLLPCTCAVSEIYCYNQNVAHLKPIFKRISDYLSVQGSTKQFLKLELNGLKVSRLEANFLAGLSFEIVSLRNLIYLQTIEKRAFDSTANRLQQLSLEEGTSRFINETNLAQINALISSMPALIRLYLDAYHLRTIPKHVFTHDNLQDLSFNYNRKRKGAIAEVENEAFYYLPNLRTLDLYNQSIAYLKRDTFLFQNDGHDFQTALFLQDNQLRASSFELGLFANVKRRLRLYLSFNNITFVEKQIFGPFFSANLENKADFGANPLQMDCRNKWIASIDTKYNQLLAGVIQVKDEDQKVLVTLDDEDYLDLHCKTISGS